MANRALLYIITKYTEVILFSFLVSILSLMQSLEVNIVKNLTLNMQSKCYFYKECDWKMNVQNVFVLRYCTTRSYKKSEFELL